MPSTHVNTGPDILVEVARPLGLTGQSVYPIGKVRVQWSPCFEKYDKGCNQMSTSAPACTHQDNSREREGFPLWCRENERPQRSRVLLLMDCPCLTYACLMKSICKEMMFSSVLLEYRNCLKLFPIHPEEKGF